MQIHFNDKIDNVLKKGIPLDPFGINNFAFPKECALNAVEELRSLGVAILGGDVYVESDDGFKANYDNWYCNRLDGESACDFVTRSTNDAELYIRRYSINGAFFVFVPDSKGL